MRYTLIARVLFSYLLCLTLLPNDANAQRGKGGPALVWKHEIVVLPNTMEYRDTTLQAFSFTVFETDPKELLELWRVDHSAKSTSIVKGDPMVAEGARIEKLSGSPLSVLVQTKGDKKAGTATMTVAFLPPPNETLAVLDVQEKVVREMAVRYNKAVVERQIAAEEKEMSKSSGKLAKSVSKDDKLNKNIQKTNASLSKIQAKRSKEQARNAKLQGDVVGAQHAYSISKDVKDLKRLTKARERLSSGETKVARTMEKEAKIQSTATKYSGNVPGSVREKEEREGLVSDHASRIEALRTKLRDIR